MNRPPLRKLILAIFGLVVLLPGNFIAAHPRPADKMTAEEVVARHLESLGTAPARAAVKSHIIQGSVVATIRIGGSGQSKGGAVMASQGNMSLLGLIFGKEEYTNEKAAFNGRKLQLGQLRPGERTNLGGFFLNHDVLFKEGLLGGALSTAWPLLNLADRSPRLIYAGTKKINNRQAHVLKYEPRNGSNLEIKLYFDAETFSHVRSEFEQTFAPPAVTRAADAARQKETHLKLLEEFSDFKAEAGLTLPHTYKVQLTFDTSNNPLLQDWVLTLTSFAFNQTIDAKQFDLTSN